MASLLLDYEERQAKLEMPQAFNSISANYQAPPQFTGSTVATNYEYVDLHTSNNIHFHGQMLCISKTHFGHSLYQKKFLQG